MTSRGERVSRTRRGTNWKKKKRTGKVGGSEVVMDAVVNGRVIPFFQEDTWNEDEETKESEYAKKSGPRRLDKGRTILCAQV